MSSNETSRHAMPMLLADVLLAAPNDTANPYSPPATRTDAPLRVHGLFLKWIDLAALLSGPAAFYGARDRQLGAALALSALALSGVVGIAWLACAWTNFPPEDRYFTKLGRYTPFSATLRLFIPIYGFYWTFVNLSMLCNAINDSLQRRSMPMRVPYALAITGPVLLLVARVATRDLDATMMLTWGAGALWFFFMLQADTARRFMILAVLAGRERIAIARETMRAGGDANAI